MTDPIVFLNGRLLPTSQAQISALDRGLLYGQAVFDTMRAYEGEVFRLDAHLNRLVSHADAAGIPLRNKHALEAAVRDVLRENKLAHARVRITVTAGIGGDPTHLASSSAPTVLVTCAPVAVLSPGEFEKGWSLTTTSARRNSTSVVARIKSTNYLENLLARATAKDAGADEALFLNERGCVAEGASSNLFFIRDGELYTPSLECGLLGGVARQVVLEAAHDAGIVCHDGAYPLASLKAASEVFVTNAVIEVMPVTALDGTTIGGGKAGAVTRMLATAYRLLVEKERGRAH